MRPWSMALAFGLAVLSSRVVHAEVPTCPTAPADAVGIAPADADFAVSARLPSLDAQPAGRRLLGLAGLDLQLGEWLRLRDACFDPAGSRAIEQLSVAGDASGNFVWLLQGEGVSSEAALACVGDWYARRDRGQTPWAAATSLQGDCLRRYSSASGREVEAIAIQNHTLALVSVGWGEEVLAAIRSGRLRALDLDEAARLARDDASQLWAAGTLHRAAGYLGQVPWRDTVRNLALRAELSSGVSIRAAVETSDFASAITRAVASSLPEQFARWRELGVPQSVLAQLKISKARELFLARWELDAAQLRQLSAALQSVVEGGGLL